MTEPFVHIILLNWNGWQDTIECVESCKNLVYANFRILIVDNGSTDNSESLLRVQFPEIEFIQTGANLGFAGGNNVGIRYALDKGADYVWLLNNDTVVEPDALSELVRTAEGADRIGMVGSKIVYFDNPRLLWYAGAELIPQKPHGVRHLGLREMDQGQFDSVTSTGYVTGCSLLARREMIEDIGLLDKGFFLYYEDVDWNARAHQAGWMTTFCPSSIVHHKVSSSIGGHASPLMVYYTSRNLLYFVRKNFSKQFTAAVLYDFYEYVLVNLKKRRFFCAWCGLKGISHFFVGKVGPLR